MKKILRRIMESGSLTDEMETDIQRLRDDFDEREGILKKYGETYVGEDKDEYNFTSTDTLVHASKESEKDWQSEYQSMRQKYLDRFFGGTMETVMNETEEDVKRDGEPQTFDQLLGRAEG